MTNDKPLPSIRMDVREYFKALEYSRACLFPYKYDGSLDTSRDLKYAEIGGFGFYDHEARMVSQLILIPQVVTPSFITYDTAGMNQILGTHPNRHNLKVKWHSHADHGLSFSSDDVEDIEELGKVMDWLISIIISPEGGYIARVDHFTPTRSTSNVRLDFVYPFSGKEVAEFKQEVAEMVSFKKPERPEPVKGRPISMYTPTPPTPGLASNGVHHSVVTRFYYLLNLDISDMSLIRLATDFSLMERYMKVISDPGDFDDDAARYLEGLSAPDKYQFYLKYLKSGEIPHWGPIVDDADIKEDLFTKGGDINGRKF